MFISHRLEELFALADRVTTLRDGAYVGTRAIADVTTDDLIRMMMGPTFAPMVDIARDPRWGRIAEGAGKVAAALPPAPNTMLATARPRPAATTTPSICRSAACARFTCRLSGPPSRPAPAA